jgi:hypothetical protein
MFWVPFVVHFCILFKVWWFFVVTTKREKEKKEVEFPKVDLQLDRKCRRQLATLEIKLSKLVLVSEGGL